MGHIRLCIAYFEPDTHSLLFKCWKTNANLSFPKPVKSSHDRPPSSGCGVLTSHAVLSLPLRRLEAVIRTEVLRERDAVQVATGVALLDRLDVEEDDEHREDGDEDD